MKTKLVPICSTICLVCAILAIGAALIWAPPCSGALELTNGNMVSMKCAYAAKAGVVLATLIAICSALSFCKKEHTFRGSGNLPCIGLHCYAITRRDRSVQERWNGLSHDRSVVYFLRWNFVRLLNCWNRFEPKEEKGQNEIATTKRQHDRHA